MMDCVTQHNNADFISKVSEVIANETLKIAILDNLLSFDAPPKGTAANIRVNFISPESRITGLHFCSL